MFMLLRLSDLLQPHIRGRILLEDQTLLLKEMRSMQTRELESKFLHREVEQIEPPEQLEQQLRKERFNL